MKYDVIHFEALGAEAQYLNEETVHAQQRGDVPLDIRYFITPLTVQEYLSKTPCAHLPELVTIKTHSLIPEEYLDGKKKALSRVVRDTTTWSTWLKN